MDMIKSPIVEAVLIGLSVALISGGVVLAFRTGLRPLIRRLLDHYDDTFVFALQWKRMTVDRIWLIMSVLFSISVVIGIAMAMLTTWIFGIVAVMVMMFFMIVIPIGLAPPFYEMMRRRRGRRIDDVLPGVLQQLAANLANNKNVGLALDEVSRTAAAPMDYELKLLAQKERDLGSLPKALDEANERIASEWFRVTAAILKTTYERSSSEAKVLQNLSRVFAQQRAMRDRIDTATRQGEASMKIMSVAPFLVVIIAPFGLPASSWEHADMSILWTVVVFGLVIAITAVGLAAYFKSQDI